MSSEEALEKLRRFCSYQDRCHQEVRFKGIALKIFGDELEECIAKLVQENFLNEERFARSYARGKFKIKNWGKNKIKQELKRREVSAYLIKKALEEIDDCEYQKTLEKLLTKEWEKNRGIKEIFFKKKLIQTCLRKGFEYEEITRVLDILLKQSNH